MDPRAKAEAMLARQSESLRKAADSGTLNDSVFGRYVSAALANGEELSRAGLRAWLVAQSTDARSAHAPLAPFVEAALRAVDDAARPSSSST